MGADEREDNTGSPAASVVTMMETGLRLAQMVSSSSFTIATNVNHSITELADRSISATADALSSHVASVVENLNLEPNWQDTLKDKISSGSVSLREAIVSVSSGVDVALSVAHLVTESGLRLSLDTMQRMERGIEFALASCSAPRKNGLRHGLLQVAKHFVEVIGPLAGVFPTELGKALGALSVLQTTSGVPYPPKNFKLLDLQERSNRDLLNDLAYCYRQTIAAYSPRLLRLCQLGEFSATGEFIHELLGIDAEAVIFERNFSEVHHPAHFVVVDHSARRICVIIRGSTEAADIVTDLCGHPHDELGSHAGMQESAVTIDSKIRPIIIDLCVKHASYDVVLEGHSLGGGVATLLCLIWLSVPIIAGPDLGRVHAYSFGPPGVIPPHTSNHHTTSVIFARDIVPRCSSGSIANLTKVLLHLCKTSTSPTGRPSFDLTRFIRSRSSMDEKSVEACLAPAPPINLDSPTPSVTSFPENESSPDSRPPTSSDSRPPTRSDSRPPTQLSTITIELLLQQLHSRNSLPPAASKETIEFWDEQLRETADLLYSLYSTDRVLVPAGRVVLVLPVQHYERAGNTAPVHLTPGGCVLLELDPVEVHQMAREILLTRESFSDHLPMALATALGLEFPSSPTSRPNSEINYFSSLLFDDILD